MHKVQRELVIGPLYPTTLDIGDAINENISRTKSTISSRYRTGLSSGEILNVRRIVRMLRQCNTSIMLSKEALWCLNLYVRNGRRFHASPFGLDPRTRIVSVSTNLWRWRIIAVTLFAYFLFAFTRLLHSFFILGLQLQDCIIHVYFVITSFFFATGHLAYWLNSDEITVFWTKFLQFDAAYTGTYSRDLNMTP